MIVTGNLFNHCHTVKTFIFRSRRFDTRISNNVKISRSYARSTIDPKDYFQVPSNTTRKTLDVFWDPSGKFNALLSLNYLRLPYIRDGLVDIAPGDKLSTCLKGIKILEVGCGGGIVSEGLAKYGAEVTGIDTCKQLIDVAQEHCSKSKCLASNKPTYILSTIEDHSISHPNTYDAIVVTEAIQHATEKELFVESCVHATKPGGKLFFTTPNRTRFAQFYFTFIFEIVLQCFPRAHNYNNFMTPSELKFMLEMNDCNVESIRGFMYYPLGDYWAWTNHKLSSFALQAVKLAHDNVNN